MSVELLSILTAAAPFQGCKPALSALLLAGLLLLSGGSAIAQGSVAGDKAALEAFYDATGGPNWITSTNWKTEEPLSTWHGVTTDATRRVTQLSLSNNQLTGTVPASLVQLDNVEKLILSENSGLTGMVPVGLRYLPNLELLNVLDTNVRAPIHAAFQEWLATIDFLGAISLPGYQWRPPYPEEEQVNP